MPQNHSTSIQHVFNQKHVKISQKGSLQRKIIKKIGNNIHFDITVYLNLIKTQV